jgi:preprotein translocase subunit SecY
MGAIKTIQNIWKIEDLRKRIISTILLVLVYRVGSFVVLPGVDPLQLDALRA